MAKATKTAAAENYKTIAENRRAHFDYILKEIMEAGLVLTGSEVKSLRKNRCSLVESFVGEMSYGPDAGSLFCLTRIFLFMSRRVFLTMSLKRQGNFFSSGGIW